MIIAFMPDLMMRSKLDVACRHYNVPVEYVSTVEELKKLDLEKINSVLIDIDADEEFGFQLLQHAISSDTRSIAFCSHILTDLIEKARQTGASMVQTNSNMTAAIPGLVSEIAFQISRNNS